MTKFNKIVLKVLLALKMINFLQLWSDWGDSARRERDWRSEGDHCQVVLQSLLVEVRVDHHPLDLPFYARFFVACCVLVQHDVNLPIKFDQM